MIGEDESSYMPAKYLAQYGAEVWKPLPDGGLVQGFIEYTTTTCSANTDRGPYYNCAYNQGRFNAEGYRYHGRVIGYTADRDAENYSMGATYTAPNGELWSATARTSRLNRDDFGDVRNTVSSVPTDYDAIELGWRGKLFGERIDVDLGVELIEPEGGERDLSGFGFIRWDLRVAPCRMCAPCTWLLALFGAGAASVASADPWLAPGDAGLRSDIQLLADAGIIRGPVTTWPMSWPDLARDVTGRE